MGEDEDFGELEVGGEELGEVDLFHLLDGVVEDKVDGLALKVDVGQGGLL